MSHHAGSTPNSFFLFVCLFCLFVFGGGRKAGRKGIRTVGRKEGMKEGRKEGRKRGGREGGKGRKEIKQ